MEKGSGGAAVVMFEERFEQFYLQLSEGKTGGMVVSVKIPVRISDSLYKKVSTRKSTNVLLMYLLTVQHLYSCTVMKFLLSVVYRHQFFHTTRLRFFFFSLSTEPLVLQWGGHTYLCREVCGHHM